MVEEIDSSKTGCEPPAFLNVLLLSDLDLLLDNSKKLKTTAQVLKYYNSHLEPRSMDDAPVTLGICRLVVVDNFKAEGGTLPRVRGMWRPARLAADGTLRQMLFPMRT